MGDDAVEGHEDLEKELEDQADDLVLDIAGDGSDIGEEYSDVANEGSNELNDNGALVLDSADDLRLVGGAINAGDSGVDDGGVLLDFDEGGAQLLADNIVGAAVEDGVDAGLLEVDIFDGRKLLSKSGSGRGSREKGREGDNAEVEETHLDGY